MSQYRKKPVVIEAIQWTGYNYTEAVVFMGESFGRWRYECTSLIISTLEGEMRCQPGDWIIKGVAGEFYPCRPDIFEQTYEKEEYR